MPSILAFAAVDSALWCSPRSTSPRKSDLSRDSVSRMVRSLSISRPMATAACLAQVRSSSLSGPASPDSTRSVALMPPAHMTGNASTPDCGPRGCASSSVVASTCKSLSITCTVRPSTRPSSRITGHMPAPSRTRLTRRSWISAVRSAAEAASLSSAATRGCVMSMKGTSAGTSIRGRPTSFAASIICRGIVPRKREDFTASAAAPSAARCLTSCTWPWGSSFTA